MKASPVAPQPLPGDGPGSGAVLSVEGLKKTLGTTQAVRDMNFSLREGEFATLLGPSGCGKSTTLRLIRGLERADDGDIAYEGKLLDSKRRNVFVAAQKRNIGIVFQSYAVWPHMTVHQNVAYPLELRRAPDIRQTVNKMLEMVGLTAVADRSAALLSGGQQQRVALARALIFNPRLLLLDEPFSNLDAQLRERVRIEVRRIQQELGTTVLFVTHDQVEALSLSDRVLLVDSGRVVQAGPPEELYDQPANRLVRDFVGRTVLLRTRAAAGADGENLVEVAAAPDIRLKSLHPLSPRLPAGTDCEVAVRPEHVQILHSASEPGPLRNSVPGRIAGLFFVGTKYDVRVQLPWEQDVILQLDRTHGLRQGDLVSLIWPAEETRIWELT